MKVILVKDVSELGKKGEIKDVRDGYARNYLIPSGLASFADRGKVKIINQNLEREKKKQEEQQQESLKLKDKIEKLEIKIPVKVGAKGKLFGSITSKDIADELEKKEIKIDKKDIAVDHIQEIGEYICIINLAGGIKANLKFKVKSSKKKE
ncbi:MAG: 50S ribosomal protein L9 [Candidatus Moranbacteria bacterium]|nr:50S ribosomal protein L9 [Candidatus Moranbacteria bacterium]